MTWLEDRYYVTWCNGYHGPTIGIGYTHDFESFHFVENALLPFNRNGVLFPRRVGGVYAMLSRPSDDGHTPFGDIYISQSPDMRHWGMHRLVMRRGGSTRPEFVSAAATRSRLSFTAESGRPTMVNPGRPGATSISTVTG